MDENQVIPDFEGYVINLRTFQIYSIKTKKVIKLLNDSESKVYVLYKNGVAIRISLFDIIKKVISKININS